MDPSTSDFASGSTAQPQWETEQVTNSSTILILLMLSCACLLSYIRKHSTFEKMTEILREIGADLEEQRFLEEKVRHLHL